MAIVFGFLAAVNRLFSFALVDSFFTTNVGWACGVAVIDGVKVLAGRKVGVYVTTPSRTPITNAVRPAPTTMILCRLTQRRMPRVGELYVS